MGIVSRRDLLSLFLRPDPEIARQVTELLTEILPAGPDGIKIAVYAGVVTLTRKPDHVPDDQDLFPVAARLVWDIDGVVDVAEEISPAGQPGPAAAARQN